MISNALRIGTVLRKVGAIARRLAVLMLSFVLTNSPARAVESAAPADAVPEYRMKAVYLSHFLNFVTWPRQIATSNQPLQICIVGVDPFGTELSFLHNKVVNKRTVDVHAVVVEALGECQLVFVSRSEQYRLNAVLNAVRNKPILTVSDIDGFAKAAGMIGFATRASQLELQINLGAARDAGLDISSKLLEVATVLPVDGKTHNKNQGRQ